MRKKNSSAMSIKIRGRGAISHHSGMATVFMVSASVCLLSSTLAQPYQASVSEQAMPLRSTAHSSSQASRPGRARSNRSTRMCCPLLSSQGAASNLDEAIRAVRSIKAGFTVADVAERGRRALRMGVQHGTVSARSNCEVDRSAGFRALEGLQQARREMAAQVDLQLIAFPQEGWFDTPGTLEDGAGDFVAQSLSRGVKVIGGNVNGALWPSKPQDQVDATFALAAAHDCDIDYHLDNADVAHAFTLPYVAEKVIAQGWQGRVAVSHIASLAQVSDAQAAQTIPNAAIWQDHFQPQHQVAHVAIAQYRNTACIGGQISAHRATALSAQAQREIAINA
jgi:hypothetical protein